MRIRSLLAASLLATVSLGFFATAACAAGLDSKPADAQSIAALESRILQAPPREQCFLYAQLLHQMTELSLSQYLAGNGVEASALLHRVQQTAAKLHVALAQRDKKLKDAEILLRHTAFRLNEMLHASSYEDRSLVEQTLAQVSQARNETMMQVFHND